MREHFCVLMYATSGEERNVTRFASYHDVNEVVAMVDDWLSKACCMDCYRPGPEEEALRAANGGQLPETAFCCPVVETPADLVKYNGFYDYESLGMFNLFLTPVYDLATAKQFRGSMNKEFEIDKEFSQRADRLLSQLDTMVNPCPTPSWTIRRRRRPSARSWCRGFPLFDEEGGDLGYFCDPCWGLCAQ